MSTDEHADKIRKLLRLAEGAGSEAEAQNAMGRAQALMAKYHLDLQAVMEADRDPLVVRDSEIEMQAGKRRVRWKDHLADIVAEAHGCVAWTAKRLTVTFGRVRTAPKSEQHEIGALPGDGMIRELLGAFVEIDPTFTLAVERTQEPHERAHVTAQWLRLRGWSSAEAFSEHCKWRVDVHACRLQNVLVMVGRKEAAQTALYMYRLLCNTVDELAREVASGKAGINSARWGILSGLQQRLETEAEIDVDVQEPSTCTALERSSLAAAVDEAERMLADSFGYASPDELYGRAKAVVVSDAAAYRRGLAASDDIDLPDPNASRTSLGGGRALPVGDDRRIR